MSKTTLTSKEFLTLYTGISFGDDRVLYSAFTKVFGYVPYSNVDEASRMGEQFASYIDKNYPDLAKIVNQIGQFKDDGKTNIFDQIDSYVAKFEKAYGKDKIEIEALYETKKEPAKREESSQDEQSKKNKEDDGMSK